MDKLEFLRNFNDLGTSNVELNHFVARGAYDVYPHKFPDASRDKLGELRRELIKKKDVAWISTTSGDWAKVYLYAPFQMARGRYRFYKDQVLFIPGRSKGDLRVMGVRDSNIIYNWESSSYVNRA